MHTVTLTVNSTEALAALIVLTIDHDVDITSIGSDPSEPVLAFSAESSWGGPALGRSTARARIDASRKRADAYSAERDEHRREVAERLANRAMRRQATEQRHADAHMAFIVECPSCGAKVNEVCTMPSGRPHSGYAHVNRIRNARMAGAS